MVSCTNMPGQGMPSTVPEPGGPGAFGSFACATTATLSQAQDQAPEEDRPEVIKPPDPDKTIGELYSAHYRSLVRLAAMFVRDAAAAEEITQDAFVAVHHAWPRLRDYSKALSYLRQSVVNRSRSLIRHRAVADKHTPEPAPDSPGADQVAFGILERSDVITALRGLPDRQREVLVLRYYADLSEAEIAKAMGISQGAVKSHSSRAISTLRKTLEPRF
jgi:RNA polymerase sigma-70 factor (sigma-E family)